MSKTRLLGIQFLRGVAANMVVLYHFYSTGLLSTYNSNNRFDSFVFFKNFFVGVDLFFVISGFIMFYISGRGNLSRKNFIISRFIRIVPLYWLVTFLQFFVSVFIFEKRISFSYLFQSLTFTVNTNEHLPLLGPGWSLQYEVLFYFICTIALFNSVRYRLIVCIVLLFLCRLLLPFGNIMIEFIFGAIAFMMGRYLSKRLVQFLTALSFLIFGFMLIIYDLPSGSMRYLFFGIPAIMIVTFFSMTQREFPGFLVVPGDYSYSLYLTHTLVISALFKCSQWPILIHLNAFIFLLLGFTVCNFFAYLFWFWIERPITFKLNLKLKKV